MAKVSKIIPYLLIILMLSILGYKSYIIIKEEHQAKMWLVLNKKVVEKANQCYLDGKCTNKTVTISYLIDNEYLINVINPDTNEPINTSSYVNLETKEFIILN